ncbi:hypothetical protein [Mucilaginibacter sp. L196]|uniref:hypothetical protein n=1 Tax=Mucilaginibacter sp. L196 TaxID=1641870 RepID=UPI00131BC068|nr:hypothetical protein [Mucilaginibacter sp. L196]
MKKRSLLYRIITCIVAGLVTAALWLLIGRGADNPLFPKSIIFTLVGISLSGIVIFPFVWQYLQKSNAGAADKIQAWLYAIIRYAVALDISIFGWKKFFHLQFIVADNISSLPMNQQSGEVLTWFYFGHSHAFGCIVASLQILGGAMLLFRKTWLPGAIILFTLMLNIMSVDIFYQMNAGALSQSVIMTIGLVFLILIDYDRLAEFFFKTQSNILSVSTVKLSTKTILRIAGVVLPVLYTWYQATH